MKTVLLFTATGPVVVLTSHQSIIDPMLLDKLRAKGIEKFIAYDLATEWVKDRYGGHFALVMQDLRESDDLRVLDFNGDRIFRLLRLDLLGEPIIHEPG